MSILWGKIRSWSGLPIVTQLLCGRARSGTQVSWPQSHAPALMDYSPLSNSLSYTPHLGEQFPYYFNSIVTISKIKFMLLKRADTATISISHHSQLSALLFCNTNCLKLLAHIPCFFLLWAFYLLLLNLKCPFHPSQLKSFLFFLYHSVQVSVLPGNEHTMFVHHCMCHVASHLSLDYELLQVRNWGQYLSLIVFIFRVS